LVPYCVTVYVILCRALLIKKLGGFMRQKSALIAALKKYSNGGLNFLTESSIISIENFQGTNGIIVKFSDSKTKNFVADYFEFPAPRKKIIHLHFPESFFTRPILIWTENDFKPLVNCTSTMNDILGFCQAVIRYSGGLIVLDPKQIKSLKRKYTTDAKQNGFLVEFFDGRLKVSILSVFNFGGRDRRNNYIHVQNNQWDSELGISEAGLANIEKYKVSSQASPAQDLPVARPSGAVMPAYAGDVSTSAFGTNSVPRADRSTTSRFPVQEGTGYAHPSEVIQSSALSAVPRSTAHGNLAPIFRNSKLRLLPMEKARIFLQQHVKRYDPIFAARGGIPDGFDFWIENPDEILTNYPSLQYNMDKRDSNLMGKWLHVPGSLINGDGSQLEHYEAIQDKRQMCTGQAPMPVVPPHQPHTAPAAHLSNPQVQTPTLQHAAAPSAPPAALVSITSEEEFSGSLPTSLGGQPAYSTESETKNSALQQALRTRLNWQHQVELLRTKTSTTDGSVSFLVRDATMIRELMREISFLMRIDESVGDGSGKLNIWLELPRHFYYNDGTKESDYMLGAPRPVTQSAGMRSSESEHSEQHTLINADVLAQVAREHKADQAGGWEQEVRNVTNKYKFINYIYEKYGMTPDKVTVEPHGICFNLSESQKKTILEKQSGKQYPIVLHAINDASKDGRYFVSFDNLKNSEPDWEKIQCSSVSTDVDVPQPASNINVAASGPEVFSVDRRDNAPPEPPATQWTRPRGGQ
jgi:hypothetical protein